MYLKVDVPAPLDGLGTWRYNKLPVDIKSQFRLNNPYPTLYSSLQPRCGLVNRTRLCLLQQ